MSNIWMPVYWSDWMRDTAMLSLQEQGAYFMLLKEYWNNGGAISDDKTRIYRSCGAQSRSEKESVNLILETYFKHENNTYRHDRIEDEILKAAENKGAQKKRTEAATAARKQKTVNVTNNVTSTPSPSPSPVANATIEEPNGSLSDSPEKPARADPCPYSEIVRVWNEVCVPAGLASVQEISDKRKKAMRGRWPQEMQRDLGRWREFCKLVLLDDFLMGRNNRDWKANLEWALRPDNITKLFEKSQSGTSKAWWENMEEENATAIIQ